MPYPVRAHRRGRPRTNEPRHRARHHIRTTKEDATSPHHEAPSSEQPSRGSPHDSQPRHGRLRLRRGSAPSQRVELAGRLVASCAGALVLAGAIASPAFAATTATSLTSLISNLTGWLVGLLAGVATLFLTLGGIRYLTAGGDPGQVEKAKVALKSAAVGYALAALAPLLVSILASLVS